MTCLQASVTRTKTRKDKISRNVSYLIYTCTHTRTHGHLHMHFHANTRTHPRQQCNAIQGDVELRSRTDIVRTTTRTDELSVQHAARGSKHTQNARTCLANAGVVTPLAGNLAAQYSGIAAYRSGQRGSTVHPLLFDYTGPLVMPVPDWDFQPPFRHPRWLYGRLALYIHLHTSVPVVHVVSTTSCAAPKGPKGQKMHHGSTEGHRMGLPRLPPRSRQAPVLASTRPRTAGVCTCVLCAPLYWRFTSLLIGLGGTVL
jgi:hypothetical protein